MGIRCLTVNNRCDPSGVKYRKLLIPGRNLGSINREVIISDSLNIGVQGLEAAMGCSESRRVVRFAADDLDVAR
jgi:hypothetical protein